MGPISVCFLFFFFTWTNATSLKVPGCFHLTLSSGLFLFSRGKALGAKLALNWLALSTLSSCQYKCVVFLIRMQWWRLSIVSLHRNFVFSRCFHTRNCLNFGRQSIKTRKRQPNFLKFQSFSIFETDHRKQFQCLLTKSETTNLEHYFLNLKDMKKHLGFSKACNG